MSTPFVGLSKMDLLSELLKAPAAALPSGLIGVIEGGVELQETK